MYFCGFYDIIYVLNNEFPCHSEEQRDEESDCIFYEILHFVQNDNTLKTYICHPRHKGGFSYALNPSKIKKCV